MAKAGRPRRVFTEEEQRRIRQLALNNCHVDTIAMALGIPKQTLVRVYGTFITQKRAEGRAELRENQRKLAKTNPAMAIFLGKNELEQTDKRDYDIKADMKFRLVLGAPKPEK